MRSMNVCLKIVDETHFIVNMDNGKTLCFRGEEKVMHSEVVSGGQGITLVVRILVVLMGGLKCHSWFSKTKKSNYSKTSLICMSSGDRFHMQ